MRVLISTGEASGDAYGAALATRMPEATISGSGGAKMRTAGVNLLADSSRWGAISIVQGLKVVPRVTLGYHRLKRELRRGQPGLFIPIDFGFANIKLARHAKNAGWKVLYFVPPGSWRRDKQGKDLPGVTDAIVTPFSWSAEILNEMGANAHWFGHPIKELMGENGLTTRGSRIAVLPGSRDHEIDSNLPLIASAVSPDHPLEFAMAASANLIDVEEKWHRLTGRTGDLFTKGETYEVLRRATGAIVCSGTATLEAALCRCPMVVVYRLTPSMQREIKLLRIKRPKYVALPNILLDRESVPELINEQATPEALRSTLAEVLAEGEHRSRQLQDFEELDAMLGPADAITKTAELAARMNG